MDEVYKYKTIAEISSGQFKDRGSKFFAFAYPVKSVEAVKPILQSLKAEHPKAVHFCYAYRIGNGGLIFRAYDDGEPSGSAGKPILGQIDSFGFINVLVVVVRYFGGTLLGVPGLINAYKAATAEALKEAVVVENWVEEMVTISFDYPVMSEVLYLLKQAEATIYKQELQLFCEVYAGIPIKNITSCLDRLSEICGLKITRIKE